MKKLGTDEHLVKVCVIFFEILYLKNQEVLMINCVYKMGKL